MRNLHPGANYLPGCLFAPQNLHPLTRWSEFAPGCRFAPGYILLRHRLHGQNTSQAQINNSGVHLLPSANCAYKRAFRSGFIFVYLKTSFTATKKSILAAHAYLRTRRYVPVLIVRTPKQVLLGSVRCFFFQKIILPLTKVKGHFSSDSLGRYRNFRHG